MGSTMNYYVYTHSTPSGDVFYVGKGIKNRAYSTSDRTIKWKEVVSSCDGINIKIVKRFENEDEAYKFEEYLISYYKSIGCSLVNYTAGERGVKDYVQSEELRLYKSKLLNGYKHKEIVCPNCGTRGGETSMKRWHFDNCNGGRHMFPSRATIFGERIYLGKFSTKEEANAISKEFKDFVVQEAS